MVKRGLLVGRFQPFHHGHLAGIRDTLKEVDELVVVIGSAQYSHDIVNPFTAGERLVMVRLALNEGGIDCSRIWIVPVPDVHLHMMWVAEIEGYVPHFDVVYTNEPLSRCLFTEAGYTVKPIRFHKRQIYSSTLIRQKMLQGDSWKQSVPRSVAAFIEETDGVNRLRGLIKSDK